MPTQPDQVRPLPVTPGPVHNETLGSYLHVGVHVNVHSRVRMNVLSS
jgi:hypothetical protein